MGSAGYSRLCMIVNDTLCFCYYNNIYSYIIFIDYDICVVCADTEVDYGHDRYDRVIAYICYTCLCNVVSLFVFHYGLPNDIRTFCGGNLYWLVWYLLWFAFDYWSLGTLLILFFRAFFFFCLLLCWLRSWSWISCFWVLFTGLGNFFGPFVASLFSFLADGGRDFGDTKSLNVGVRPLLWDV